MELEFYQVRWVVFEGERNPILDSIYQEIIYFSRDYGIFNQKHIEIIENAYLSNDIDKLQEAYIEIQKDYKEKEKEANQNIQLVIAYADTYDKIYNDDSVIAHQHYIGEMHKAFLRQDIDALYKLYDSLHDSPKDRILSWYYEEIQNKLQCNISEIQDILDDIKTTTEASIVLSAIESLDWITSLPKGYNAAKKRKYLKKTHKHSQFTYEQQLRASRHLLEKQLQSRKCNVGINRSKRISKILLSI